MRVKIALALVIIMMAGLLLTVNVMSEEKKMTEEEKMAVYMKYAAPGEAHRALNPLVGSWDYVSKMWQDPAAPPQESKGSSESKWILGGRFVQEDVSGEMMGAPFHGLSITGYDNYKKEYISLWFDDMTTGFITSTGSIDASGKIITFSCPMPDYVSGKIINYKSVTRITSNDQHVYEMYMVGEDGKEWKIMELTSTRKK